ncbi:alpha-L-arabinofuranosidase [Alicyclobacillus mali]|uniref:Alpha-L-arabinofuranosidase n=1 Tax=Alicyclobacillus mali (ex Roth et al. 2021) TaxID=1123961 RepID=A0ABS0F3L9_9BACL|nr:alpha-L-arabinofuranosidase [Alicyclobacillus mali (ex Roth et al. 2021)]MBF8377873.1 alpha-L-arabinofuranosidase [Alicyclobacillus mali (ex Roth et al. 2021)]
MKKTWSASLAAVITLWTGASPAWAAAHPTAHLASQHRPSIAARVRADDFASTSMATEMQVIHDALTVPELAAVQAAAQAASNLSTSQWLQWLYPNASSATSAQSQAAQAVANLFNLATYGTVSTRGSNTAQILQTLQSISPLLSSPAVGLFYQSFLTVIGQSSKAILAGQASSSTVGNALAQAASLSPTISAYLRQNGLSPSNLARTWSSFETQVDPQGAAQTALMTRICTNALGFGAPTASATITVNAATRLQAVPATAFGLNAAVWDSGLNSQTVISEVQALHPALIRWPGGSISDVYNWETNTRNDGGYVNPNDTFDNFMQFVNAVGSTPIITVNYGTGTPQLAADWVKYADVTHHDNVLYWELGNETYGNGYYNGNGWEADDHAVPNEPQKGNPGLSPQAYAQNALQFIQAMRAVDPNIKIGAVLTMPYNWPWGATVNGNDDWNTVVLKALGPYIDFVDVHWYPETPGQETDAGLLADTDQIPAMVAELKREINAYAGSNAKNIQIFVTETNSVSYNPGQQSTNLPEALFLADDLAGFVQAGAANVDWWDLLNGAEDNYTSPSLYGQNLFGDYGLLSSGQTTPKGVQEPPEYTPLPPYYGFQLVSDFARPGDTFLGSASSQSDIDVHAVREPNGDISLMLVNRSPSTIYSANLNVLGVGPYAITKALVYGEGSSAVTPALTLPTAQSIKLMPYSGVDLVLHPLIPAPHAAASVTDTLALSSPTVTAGGSETVTASFSSDRPVHGATVELELYDSTGDLVASHQVTGVEIAPGAPASESWTFAAPSANGTYTVEAFAFDPATGATYDADTAGATLTVNQPPAAKYGDIVTQNTVITVNGTTYNVPAPDASGHYPSGTNISIAPGDTVTIQTTFANVSSTDALQNGLIDVEVDGQNGAIFQKYWPSTTLLPGQTQTVTATWQVPSSVSAGTYPLNFQAFDTSNWTGNCYFTNGGVVNFVVS